MCVCEKRKYGKERERKGSLGSVTVNKKEK